jgi:hypothetical protein
MLGRVAEPAPQELDGFYTVQSDEDAARLRGMGTPWPNSEDRATLGEGVYAWRSRSEARRYWERLARRNPSLQILSFRIRDRVLSSFRCLRVDALEDPEAWLSRYSRLWGGVPDHGWSYVQRGTEIGVEHFFAKAVFRHLRFR